MSLTTTRSTGSLPSRGSVRPTQHVYTPVAGNVKWLYLLFLLPIVSPCDSCEGLYFMQDGAPHVLRFLVVHGLTTVLLLGGLGVGKKQIDLYEVPNFILVLVCGVGSQRNSTDQMQGNFFAVPLDFLDEKF